MDLTNKIFKNNQTGEKVKIIGSFEDIAILENKQKMSVSNLMDPSKFTEEIDPSSFFNNQNAYNSLADKIKNIPTNNIVDGDGEISMNVDERMQPVGNESAIMMVSEEDERAELMRKYDIVNNDDSISKQNDAFSKILNDEEETTTNNVYNNQNDNIQRVEVIRDPIEQRIENNPIIDMFKGVKRNVNFDISVVLSDKIPRLDFIEMMEDSYDISLIDFLATEFTNKILKDPNEIKKIIKDKINQIVYGDIKEIKETKKIDKIETKKVKKLSVSERIDRINKSESLDMVNKYLKDEKTKSVKDAGQEKIKKLQ